MQTTFVDEFRLRAELGPTVEYLSVGELKRLSEALPQPEVDSYLAGLRQQFPVRGVSEATLVLAARASLGLAHLAVERWLSLISLNDIAPELHEVLGLRPCLYPPLFDQAGLLAGLEGDLGAATAMFILNRLTGSPVLFAETWFWDEVDNLIVTGHAGPQNPALARPGSAWISHDLEFAQSDRTEGAHLQFVARPGRVTLFQLRSTPTSWQAIVTTGAAIETEPWVEGYPHAVIRLDVPIDQFLHQVAAAGSTQHWAVAYGEAQAGVVAVCHLLNIPLQVIG
jgi:L-fucose isomerase-like protein